MVKGFDMILGRSVRPGRSIGLGLLCLAAALGMGAHAASVPDYAVQLTATTELSPPRITLTWPADIYYGDMSGTWTDSSVNSTINYPRNRNTPGDGKFDQDAAPVGPVLQVGRVDLASMSAFGKPEIELLRQYLAREHGFRHTLWTARPRGLVDDHFGEFGGEAFAASAWRSFAPCVGYGNVAPGDWFALLPSEDYLLAYGCGPGTFESAAGVGSTADFAAKGSKAVFNRTTPAWDAH